MMGTAKSNGEIIRGKKINDSFRDLQRDNVHQRQQNHEARIAELEQQIAQLIVTATFQIIMYLKDACGNWKKELWDFELSDSKPRFTGYRKELEDFLDQPAVWLCRTPRKYLEADLALNVWRFYASKCRRLPKSDKERGAVVRVLCMQLQVVARKYRQLPGLPREVLQPHVTANFLLLVDVGYQIAKSLSMEETRAIMPIPPKPSKTFNRHLSSRSTVQVLCLIIPLTAIILQSNALSISRSDRGFSPGSIHDADFYSALRNTFMQVLGLYIALFPALRYAHMHAQYPWWARILAVSSLMLSLGASVAYVVAASISPLLGCLGSVLQVFMVLQLALKFDGRIEKIEAGMDMGKMA